MRLNIEVLQSFQGLAFVTQRKSIRFLPDLSQVRILPRALLKALLCNIFTIFRTTTYIINYYIYYKTMRVCLRSKQLLFMKG